MDVKEFAATTKDRFGWLVFAVPPVAVLGLMIALFGYLMPDVMPGLSSRWKFTSAAARSLGEGRFEWMAFVIAGAVLFSACIWLGFGLFHRHLPKRDFWLASVASSAIALGVALWPPPPRESFVQQVLFAPTRALVWPAYDADFGSRAMLVTKLVYGFGLAATVFIVLSAACVMSRHPADGLRRKQLDLKIVIVAAALLMTFIANFLGHWLRWPGKFSSAGAKEIESFANGLQLYFGASYTLALLAFAIPAVAVLSDRLVPVEPPAPDGSVRAQRIFKPAEISVLLSTALPFITTLIGSKIPIPMG